MNCAGYSALSFIQIEITDGYELEASVISLPNVIALAGIAGDNKAEIIMPRAINFNLTGLVYLSL